MVRLWFLLATTVFSVFLLKAQIIPAGFTDTLVASLPSPTAFTFTPDGRMLVTTQGGTIRVIPAGGGAPLPTPALSFPANALCTNSERGFLGIAIDPDFSANGFVYLYYTPRPAGSNCAARTSPVPSNRVSRFIMRGNVIDPASERILLNNIPSWNGNHNGGDLHFGTQDGLLYISVGDSGCDPYPPGGCAGANDAARDVHTLLGKILRIDRDGNIPASNPWTGEGTQRCNESNAPTGIRCQETYAWGLRNPFRIAFDRNRTSENRFFILDVGQDSWEEINLGIAGADYGWNVREGPCVNGSRTNCPPPPAGMVDPIFAYPHGVVVPGTQSRGCDSITGGAFVPNGYWPAAYDGAFLYADYVCGSIFRLSQNADGTWRTEDFVRGLGSSSAVHLGFGPFQEGNQALYYTTYQGGGQVRRIAYTAGRPNAPPTAVISASVTSGRLPLVVNFSAQGSSDPDAGDTLTFLWDFGDGSDPVTTAAPTVSHTYTRAGVFTATLRARDNRNAVSAPASIRIFAGNTAPVPTIHSPAATDRFEVNQTIVLRGSAVDAEDGPLPDSALAWTVILHHDTHTHPFVGPLPGGAGAVFFAPAPEDLDATQNSYLEIVLQARDSAGEVTTVSRDFRPLLTPVTFNTSPAGLTLRVNGLNLTAPRTIVSWAAYSLATTAPDQDLDGKRYVFRRWSVAQNAQARDQVFHTPRTPVAYTATFESVDAIPAIVVSDAAGFQSEAIAAGGLAAISGRDLAAAMTQASDAPWPVELGGLRVMVADLFARIYSVAADSVIFEVPDAPVGRQMVRLWRGETLVGESQIDINRAAPGLFTVSGDGKGQARGSWRLAGSDETPRVLSGETPVEAASGNAIVAFQATGLKNAAEITVRMGGLPVPVAGVASTGFPGLEELQVRLPALLAGRGEVQVLVTADQRQANPVTVTIR